MTDTNTAVGVNALGALPTGADNTAVGANALKSATSSTPIQNVAVGSGAGNGITSGSGNVVIGYDSASSLTTGSNNIVIGTSASVPSASTSGYLNIGGAISGSTVSSGSITLNPLVNFKAKTQLSTDNSTNLATTAFVTTAVGAATGAMQFLTSSTMNTATNGYLNLGAYIANDQYRRIELFISNLVGPSAAPGTTLQLLFRHGSTAVTTNSYAALIQGAGVTTLSSSPWNIVNTWSTTYTLDGTGEIVLRNFCRSNTTVYPSAKTNISSVSSNLSNVLNDDYDIVCVQPGVTFDGLVFVDGLLSTNAWTFNWALYGIV